MYDYEQIKQMAKSDGCSVQKSNQRVKIGVTGDHRVVISRAEIDLVHVSAILGWIVFHFEIDHSELGVEHCEFKG